MGHKHDDASAGHLSRQEIRDFIARFRVTSGDGFALKHHPTRNPEPDFVDKGRAPALLSLGVDELSTLQETLYAESRWSVLLVFQAMDAAGKDSTIKHVMTGVNPQGVDVTSFKQPGPEDLGHDFLWRISKALPARGMIGIFNRSHYEEVLVARGGEEERRDEEGEDARLGRPASLDRTHQDAPGKCRTPARSIVTGAGRRRKQTGPCRRRASDRPSSTRSPALDDPGRGRLGRRPGVVPGEGRWRLGRRDRPARVAGVHGNRTHQRPVSRPLDGFEDRGRHQPNTHSPGRDAPSAILRLRGARPQGRRPGGAIPAGFHGVVQCGGGHEVGPAMVSWCGEVAPGAGPRIRWSRSMVGARRILARYSAPVVIVLVATLIRWGLDSYLNDRAPLIVYFLAVALAARLGGLGPGLLAMALGGLAADYFFIPPRWSLGGMKPENLLGLALYWITGLIIALLAESQRRAVRRAERSAGEALERQVRLEAEIARRERVELEREGLLVEQARLRAVAEEQAATLAGLFHQVPVGIALFDADFRIVQVNSRAAGVIGTTPDRLIGRVLREVLRRDFPGPEIERIERIFRGTIEAGEPFAVKAWASGMSRPGTEVVYFDWSIRRVEGPDGGTLGVLGTILDVTEDVCREQALRQSEERFRLAAEAVDGLIYDANMATGQVDRTRGLSKLLGYRPEEAPPTFDWWMEQVHPDDVGRLRDAGARLEAEGGRSVIEYRVRHRDGHYVHVVDRSMAASDESGRVVRHVGCTQDVTEIRQAEASLREADRRKDEFLAVLAHEIRNPLASIRNSLRLMERADGDGRTPAGPRAADLESERAMAERQVAHLARLIDDLMDVSRISRGRIELRRRPIELAPVLERAIEAARSPMLERGHDFSVELPPGPIRLEADPTRLEQVFGNLLSNATKYTPPGGRISVRAEVQGGEVVVTVRDSGLGIGPEMLPRVFEMFVQDGTHARHAEGGLGIGLGLSKSLVELHGGRISARSDGPGLGSEFEVALPLSVEVAPESDGPGEDGRLGSAPATPRRRILVVDDNEAVALSLSRLLERAYKQDVRVAHDGPSALEVAGEFRPDVVLLDIGLPVMDGCEVARRLRERPEFATTYVVALTGWGQEADRRRSEDAGIDRHMVKPIDPDELADLIAGARGTPAGPRSPAGAPITPRP